MWPFPSVPPTVVFLVQDEQAIATVKLPLEKDGMAVVPVSWLSEDHSRCRWPEDGRTNGKGVLALAEQVPTR